MNAVDLIVAGRKEGRFKGLDDFAHRVDLGKVGKRSLEFLIKAGALDDFGSRGSMLHVLDTLTAVSASHFRALECGQMSIFGGEASVEEPIHLDENADVDLRTQLEWEKELLGLYVSNHPLTPYLPVLQKRSAMIRFG